MLSAVMGFIMDVINQNLKMLLSQQSRLQKSYTTIAHIAGRKKQDIMMNQYILISIGLSKVIK